MIVTRFAPSPTGFIHMGSLYASFVSYIFAKQTDGVFFLRIEDTDTARTVENGVSKILNVLKDFNIDIRAGHKIALVGATGSGKTTIVNLLLNFYDIDSGEMKNYAFISSIKEIIRNINI